MSEKNDDYEVVQVTKHMFIRQKKKRRDDVEKKERREIKDS